VNCIDDHLRHSVHFRTPPLDTLTANIHIAVQDLLGLESPDELDVQEEKVVDVKYWRTDDSLPEQEVVDIDSPDIDGELPEAE